MRRLSLGLLLFASGFACAGESKIAGRVSPDGKEEIALDLPASQHLRNKTGTDGLGLCVWTSLAMSGDWCNEDALRSLQQHMTREKGGGWPERVDEVLPRLAPGVAYLQYTGRDATMIRTAIRTGRMPCVTYGYSPRYVGPRNPGGRVAHMVNCVHYSLSWVAILDNNFPGDNQYEWMTPAEFVYRWMLGNPNGGWVVLPLHCGPTPIPINHTIHRSIHRFAHAQPLKSPTAPLPVSDSVQDFGVRQDRLSSREGFSINGRPVTQTEAEHALKRGGGISDDSGKWRLTVIAATKAKRDRVLNDLQTHPLLASWRERLCVQSYAPDVWAVTGVNLPRGGEPTIVLQTAPDANGKATVLHCQHDYDDGPEGLVKALRTADPNFNPKTVPDLRVKQPEPPPLPSPPPTPPPASGIHWLTIVLSTAIPLVLWLLGKSYPALASVLSMLWAALKPNAMPTVPTPDLQRLLDRLSKLEQQQQPK